MWSHGLDVISFQSAADVHDIGDFDLGSVHLTLPVRRSPASGIALHVGELDDADVEDRGPYRVTTATRTVLDLASGKIGQEQFSVAVRDALTSGRVTSRTLRRRMDDFGSEAALRLERALAVS